MHPIGATRLGPDTSLCPVMAGAVVNSGAGGGQRRGGRRPESVPPVGGDGLSRGKR